MPLHAVIDTNVVYAGLRSRSGASYQILDELERHVWTMVLSNTVLTEYEEILKREVLPLASLLAPEEFLKILRA